MATPVDGVRCGYARCTACPGVTILSARRAYWHRDEDEVELTEEDYDRLRPEDLPEDISQTWYDELLSGWRDLSRQARATIRLARRLHDGKLGDQADWDALPFLQQPLVRLVVPRQGDPFATLDDLPDATQSEQVEVVSADRAGAAQAGAGGSGVDLDSDRDEPYRRRLAALGRRRMVDSIEFQRLLLGEVLNYWLELAGVRPRLDWSTAKPAVQLGGYGLMARSRSSSCSIAHARTGSPYALHAARHFCQDPVVHGEIATSTVRTAASKQHRGMRPRDTARRRNTN